MEIEDSWQLQPFPISTKPLNAALRQNWETGAFSSSPTHPFSGDQADLTEGWREDKITGGCLCSADQS